MDFLSSFVRDIPELPPVIPVTVYSSIFLCLVGLDCLTLAQFPDHEIQRFIGTWRTPKSNSMTLYQQSLEQSSASRGSG